MTRRERIKNLIAKGNGWVTFFTRLLLICSAATAFYYALALPPVRWVAAGVYRMAITPVLAQVREADLSVRADARVADSLEAVARMRGDDSVLVEVRALTVEIRALNKSLDELGGKP